MRSLLVASLALALVCTSAHSAAVLKENWRLPLDLHQVGQVSPALPLTVDGSTVVVATQGGAHVAGIDGNTGSVLWNTTGHANVESLMTDSTIPGLVFIHFQGPTFEGWNSTTGKMLWVYTPPANSELSDIRVLSQSIVFFNDLNVGTNKDPNLRGNLVRLDAVTGTAIYTTAVPSKYADSSYWLSATPDAITLGFYVIGKLVTYDAKTGAQTCEFTAAKNTIYLPPGAFAGKYGLLYVDQDDKFYNLLNCSSVSRKDTNPAVTYGNEFYVLHTDYDFQTKSGQRSFSLAKYDVEAGKNTWNVSLAFYGNHAGGSPNFVAGLPFNSEVLMVISNGYLQSLNATTGAVKWSAKTFLPTGHPGSVDNLVYPLGDHTLFVPNLQGYSVYDLNTQTVIADTESLPIAGSRSIAGSSANMVVYAEVLSGDLIAISKN